jgi:hypothetical protein
MQVAAVGVSVLPMMRIRLRAALRRVGTGGAARSARGAARPLALDQLRLYSATHLSLAYEGADGTHSDLSAVGEVISS